MKTTAQNIERQLATFFTLLAFCLVAAPAHSALVASYGMDNCEWKNIGDELVDLSGNRNHGTSFADVRQTTGKVCQAATFNSTQNLDYVELPKATLHNLRDYTISAWIKTTSRDTQTIISGAANGEAEALTVLFRRNRIFTRIDGTQQRYNLSSNLHDGNWHHIVVARDGSDEYVYVDNSLVRSRTVSSSKLSVKVAYLGQNASDTSGSFRSSHALHADLDEVRIYDSWIGEAALTTLYDAQNAGQNDDGSARDCTTYCPIQPFSDALHASYGLDSCEWDNSDNNALDSSANAYHGTSFDDVRSEDGVLCKAAVFSSTSNADYIELPSDTLDGLSTYTVAFWFKSTSRDTQTPISGAKNGEAEAFLVTVRRQRVETYINGDRQRYNTGIDLNNGNWHHIAIARSEGKESLYINGEKFSSRSVSDSTLNIQKVYIGQDVDDRSGSRTANIRMRGSLDEFRIFNDWIGTTNINTLYTNHLAGTQDDGSARDCSTFCPVLPFHDALHAGYGLDNCEWSEVENEVEDISGNSYHGTTANDVGAQDGKLCKAAEFNASGNTDYVDIPVATLHGLTDFTITAWINTSNTNTQTILSGARNGQAEALTIRLRRNRFYVKIDNAQVTYRLPSSISDGDWHHVVVSRKGTKQTLFLDGNQIDSATVTSDALNVEFATIGQNIRNLNPRFRAGERFRGLIDELRIYNAYIGRTNITTLYQNQNAGNNDDGSSRNCGAYCPNLIGRWSLGECAWTGAASEVLDLSGNNYHGQANGDANTQVDNICKVGVFDGNADRVTGATTGASLSGGVTLIGWFNSDGKAGTQRIFELGSHYVDLNFDTNTLSARTVSSDGSTVGAVSHTDASITSGTWKQFAYTYDNTTAKIYINGSKLFELTDANDTNNLENPSTFALAGKYSTSVDSFDGKLKDMRIYDQAISDTLVYAHYIDESRCDCTAPSVNLGFDECRWTPAASEALDYTGTSHGTPFESVQTVASGALCRAAEFNTNSNIDDYLTMPAATLNGLNDFTVSAWFNTSSSKRQTIISGANASEDDAFWWRINNRRTIAVSINGNSKGYRVGNINDGNWHMVTFTREGTTGKIYLDGVLKKTRNNIPNTTLDIEAITIGQDQDSVGGGFNRREIMLGKLDDIIVYQYALNASEITDLFDNIQAGNDAAGEPVACELRCAEPIGDYRFDACSLGGGSTIQDDSGNGNDGIFVNGGGSTNGALCKAGTFDGIDDRITGSLPQQFGKAISLSAWVKINGPNLLSEPTVVKVANASGARSNAAIITAEQNGTLQGWAESSNGNRYGEVTYVPGGKNIGDGNWHHVVYTYDSQVANLYIDGALASTANSANPTATLLNATTWSVGGDYDGNTNVINGSIDEVRIYNGLLSARDVTQIYTSNAAGNHDNNTTRTCSTCNNMDHYEVSHGGSAISCEATTITVTPKSSSNVTTSRDLTTTITLSTSTGVGLWTLESGSGTLVETGLPTDGQATYTFSALGEDEVQFGLLHPAEGTVSINVTDGTYTETSGAADAADDPNLTVSSFGFKFYGDAVANSIDNLTAGKDSTQSIILKAIQTDTDTGQCGAAISGIQPVKFGYECIEPSTCAAGTALTINGDAASANASGAVATFNDINLTFDGNGETPLTLNFNDAGSVKLHVQLPLDVGVGNSITVQGTSNAFDVLPFGYYLNAGNGNAINETSNLFLSAGDEFTATVSAVAWEAGDDATSNADLANNAVLPNFGNESLANQASIVISANHLHPSTANGGVAGSLSGGGAMTATNGTATATDLAYSEVGVITLTANISDYLGEYSGAITSQGIGRFSPSYFEITNTGLIENRSSIVGCNDAFSYMGENFSTDFTITAYNFDGDIVSNYEAGPGYDYAFLSTTDLAIAAIDSPEISPTTLTSRLNISSITGDFTNGTGNFNITLNVDRPLDGESEGPFDAFTLGVNPTDPTDGIGLAPGDLDLDPAQSGSDTHAALNNTIIRLGRVALTSNAGSELTDLPVKLSVEYYDGSGYVTNAADNCTTYSGANLVMSEFSGDIDADNVSASGTSAVSSGKYDASNPMTIAAPEGGTTGSFVVTLPLDSFPYLQSNWNGVDEGLDNQLNDDNPSAGITFGIYLNKSDVIYKQEVY